MSLTLYLAVNWQQYNAMLSIN